MNALLIIDMQNDFVDGAGRALVAQAKETVPVIAKLLNHWRQQGWPVIHILRQHHSDGSDSELFRRHAPVCVAGSWGADSYSSLEPQNGEFVVVKTRFSAFFKTELAQLLADNHIDKLTVCGTQLPNCVRGTVMDALYRDIQIRVVEDGCSAQNQQVARANLTDMANMGAELIHSELLL